MTDSPAALVGIKAGDRVSGFDKSQDFIEQQARDKLGLAKEGETIVIIPEEKINQVLGMAKQVVEPRLPNWQGWLRLFWR